MSIVDQIWYSILNAQDSRRSMIAYVLFRYVSSFKKINDGHSSCGWCFFLLQISQIFRIHFKQGNKDTYIPLIKLHNQQSIYMQYDMLSNFNFQSNNKSCNGQQPLAICNRISISTQWCLNLHLNLKFTLIQIF